MSRTDKTKPPWVRFAEHEPRPIHDHRHGACDLPPVPTRADTDTHCRWVRTTKDLYSRACCSGCKIRSHIAERQRDAKADNRRRRYADRRAARRFTTDPDRD